MTNQQLLQRILGKFQWQRKVLIVVYCLIISSLFLPFMEVFSFEKINASSQFTGEVGYFTVLIGFDFMALWGINLLITLWIHFRAFTAKSPQNAYYTVVSTLLYPIGVFLLYFANGMSGGPFHDVFLVGFYTSLFGTSLLIVSCYVVAFSRVK
ncbi:MAG: hypothetical protein E6Q37_03650 [Crocinitomicaceae bacterium]|nr:MAG: hypothetical protein E6Q37_03650 [Crocinitomicaceae bacterium]